MKRARDCEEGEQHGWETFLDHVIPWAKPSIGEVNLVADVSEMKMADPKCRVLNFRLDERINLSQKGLAEKFLTLIKGGLEAKDSLIRLVTALQGFLPGQLNFSASSDVTADDVQCATAYCNQMSDSCQAILAISGTAGPGSVDNSIVKRVMQSQSDKISRLCGIVAAGMNASAAWQDHVTTDHPRPTA